MVSLLLSFACFLSFYLSRSIYSDLIREGVAMLGLSYVASLAPRDPFHQLTITLCVVGLFLAAVFVLAFRPRAKIQAPSTFEAYLKFIYGCFLKPHTGDGSGSQQDALVGLRVLECLLAQSLIRRRRASIKHKPTFTMQLVSSSCVVAKICLDLLQRS